MADEAKPQEDAQEPPPEDGAGAPEAPPDAADGPDADVAVAEPEPPRRPAYAFLAIVSIVTLAADLGTKWWATSRLQPGERSRRAFSERRIEVIEGHLNFIFAENRGGAFGLLGDEHEAIRRPFFLLISVIAVVFIVSLFRKLHPSQTALKWGLPLVLGGALGNLVDRIRYGFVVDFIQIYLTPSIRWTYPWPTFNVADIAIVVGVGLMAIDMFTARRRPEAKVTRVDDKASAGEG